MARTTFLKRILRLNVKIVKYEIVSNFVLKYVQSCVMVMKGYKGMEKAVFGISFFFVMLHVENAYFQGSKNILPVYWF